MRPPLTAPQIVEWTLSDGYLARGRWWPGSSSNPTTAVVYLHGIQSHGGWYEWSGSRLAAIGLPVVMPDRRGSGLNNAARGDTPSAERWLHDLDDVAAWLRSHGISRIAVLGVSWGGKLALAWALARRQLIERILLITPGVFPQVGVGFAEKVRIGAALLAGGRARHAIPLDDPALFTLNPAGQAFIAADDRKLAVATARFLYQSSRLDRLLVRTRPGALTCPVSLLLAEQDRIIRNDATEHWLRRVAAQPPRVTILAAAAHTLEFEAEAGPFERELLAWAASVTANPSAGA